MGDEQAQRMAGKSFDLSTIPQTTTRGLRALVKMCREENPNASRTVCAYYILAVSPYWRGRGYNRIMQLLNELYKNDTRAAGEK